MLYIFLCVCCSVAVSVLLKLAKRYQVDIFQAITWNYSIAIILTWIFLKPQLANLHSSPFYIYSLLGFLLPLLFVVIAISVTTNGIIRTEIAQRLSLFIPVIASFLLFGEHLTLLKSAGIIIGFAAIVCSIPLNKQRSPNKRGTANGWAYLLVVFAGMGVIDILFKQMAVHNSVSFSTSLFLVYIISFVLAMFGLLYRFGSKKSKFSWPHILFGWILGVFNFGNILFYIKAQQSMYKTPSLVFSSVDIGVIALGSVVGILIFKEKLSLVNKIGIGLALIAIIIFYCPNLF
jgi:drug/metabolite transporter (DMT)-like permease